MMPRGQIYGMRMQAMKRRAAARKALYARAAAEVSEAFNLKAQLAGKQVWLIYAPSLNETVQARLRTLVSVGWLTVHKGPAGGVCWAPHWVRASIRGGVTVIVAAKGQYTKLPDGVTVNHVPAAKLEPVEGERLRWWVPSRTLPDLRYVVEWLTAADCAVAGLGCEGAGKLVCTCPGFMDFGRRCWHVSAAEEMILKLGNADFRDAAT